MQNTQIGTSKFENLDIAQMLNEKCSHAIFSENGKITVGSNVSSSYPQGTPGLLCAIDMEHNMDASNYSADYTVADWVDESIDNAMDRLQEAGN